MNVFNKEALAFDKQEFQPDQAHGLSLLQLASLL